MAAFVPVSPWCGGRLLTPARVNHASRVTLSSSRRSHLRMAADDVPAASKTEGADASADSEKTPQQLENERLRAAEKFIELETSKYECRKCGYSFDPDRGDSLAGIAPGTRFEDIDDSAFRCPACKSPKSMFRPEKKIIAGFAENQSYGFGGNTLTGGQKNGLIFGGLAVLFVLLISGYLLE